MEEGGCWTDQVDPHRELTIRSPFFVRSSTPTCGGSCPASWGSLGTWSGSCSPKNLPENTSSDRDLKVKEESIQVWLAQKDCSFCGRNLMRPWRSTFSRPLGVSEQMSDDSVGRGWAESRLFTAGRRTADLD